MRRLGTAGFTLTELMLSLTLLTVILGSVVGVVVKMQQGYVNQREAARAEDALRVAETTILNVFRTAESNPLSITGAQQPRILANPLNRGAFDNVRVLADFNPWPDGDVLDNLEDVLIHVTNDTLWIKWRSGVGSGSPVAAPVRSLLFEYYPATGNTPLAAAQIGLARRVKIILTAPRHPRTNALLRRESWVFLRNRR